MLIHMNQAKLIQAKVTTFTQFFLKMYKKQISLDEGFG